MSTVQQTPESVISGGGVVELGVDSRGKIRYVQVAKLSAREEYGLGRLFARLAKDAMGPGGYFAAAQPRLEWLRKNGMIAEWKEAVAEISRLVATNAPVPEETVDDFRATKEGVALELYHRTRKTHPEVQLDELRAIITDVNALDLHCQILEAISDQGKA